MTKKQVKSLSFIADHKIQLTMFKVLLIRKNKIESENLFQTEHEAENFVFGEARALSYKYEVYDTETNKIIDDGELESGDEIIEATMNDLFPDGDNMEDFDVNDHFGDS